MNWGRSIVIVYAIFVLGIGFLVFKSTQETFEVVDVDYYQREQEFSAQLEAQNRANQSGKIPKVRKDKKIMELEVPAEINKSFSGEIFAYCPTSKKLDAKITMKQMKLNNDSVVREDLLALKKSKYILKVNWKIQNENYYSEVAFER